MSTTTVALFVIFFLGRMIRDAARSADQSNARKHQELLSRIAELEDNGSDH